MTDLVDIGGVTRDPSTNALVAQAKGAQVGDVPDDAPPLDNVPVFGALGITALPWPADDRGGAQGISDEGVPGHNGVITSMRDARAAGVVEELGPGETAIHSTGPDFDSRVFLKKQMAAVVVGDDVALVLDRENQRNTLTAYGSHIEQSAANGIVLTMGSATIQIKDGVVMITGQIVLGGRTPLGPLAWSPAPVVGTSGATSVAAGVFVGV